MTLVQLNEIYEVPSGSDMADAEALLQDAFQSFRNSLEKGNPAAAMDMIGDVLDIGGHPAADFAGLSDHTGAGGLYYWARLIIANGKVWMIFSLTDRKDHPVLKALMESVVLTPGGG